jgi:methylmalonyl-CoA mutase cobalamin-binding subunit
MTTEEEELSDNDPPFISFLRIGNSLIENALAHNDINIIYSTNLQTSQEHSHMAASPPQHVVKSISVAP